MRPKLFGTSGIYKIQSISNRKMYIGSAINLGVRKQQHFNMLRKNKHPNIHLQRHFNKYGEVDLVFVVVFYCEKSLIREKEQYYIDRLQPAFNIQKIVGLPLGTKRTTKFKKHLQNLRSELYGKPVFQFDLKGNFIAKYRSRKEAARITGTNNNSIAFCCSKKYKSANNFIWTSGRVPTQKEIKNVKVMKTNIPVNQYTLSGIFVKSFFGIKEAGKQTSIDHNCIRCCLNGKQKTAGGFIWKLKNKNYE